MHSHLTIKTRSSSNSSTVFPHLHIMDRFPFIFMNTNVSSKILNVLFVVGLDKYLYAR
ncbi:hypothetical protein LEP1GSC166_0226 [Leptospira kirschneri]|nr:hypothetical protein LEP1GSC166_0226 [Leptospira kirschneri]